MTAGGLVVVAARRGGGGEGRGGVTATSGEPAGAAARGTDVRVEPAGAPCDVAPASNRVRGRGGGAGGGGGGGEGRGGVTATLVEPAGAAATGMDVRVEPAGATCDVGPESNAVGVSGAIRAAGAKSHQAMPTAASATVPSTS